MFYIIFNMYIAVYCAFIVEFISYSGIYDNHLLLENTEVALPHFQVLFFSLSLTKVLSCPIYQFQPCLFNHHVAHKKAFHHFLTSISLWIWCHLASCIFDMCPSTVMWPCLDSYAFSLVQLHGFPMLRSYWHFSLMFWSCHVENLNNFWMISLAVSFYIVPHNLYRLPCLLYVIICEWLHCSGVRWEKLRKLKRKLTAC